MSDTSDMPARPRKARVAIPKDIGAAPDPIVSELLAVPIRVSKRGKRAVRSAEDAMSETITAHLNMKVTAKVHTIISTYAKANGLELAEFVVMACAEYIKNHPVSFPTF